MSKLRICLVCHKPIKKKDQGAGWRKRLTHPGKCRKIRQLQMIREYQKRIKQPKAKNLKPKCPKDIELARNRFYLQRLNDDKFVKVVNQLLEGTK